MRSCRRTGTSWRAWNNPGVMAQGEDQTEDGEEGEEAPDRRLPLAHGDQGQDQAGGADVRAELDEEARVAPPVGARRRVAEEVGKQQAEQALGRQGHLYELLVPESPAPAGLRGQLPGRQQLHGRDRGPRHRQQHRPRPAAAVRAARRAAPRRPPPPSPRRGRPAGGRPAAAGRPRLRPGRCAGGRPRARPVSRSQKRTGTRAAAATKLGDMARTHHVPAEAVGQPPR